MTPPLGPGSRPSGARPALLEIHLQGEASFALTKVTFNLGIVPCSFVMSVSFDKTTEATRMAGVVGYREAARLGHAHFGTEHYLLGVLWGSEVTPDLWGDELDAGLAAAEALRRSGNPAGDALNSLGIFLEPTRARVAAREGTTAEELRPGDQSDRPMTKKLGRALFPPRVERIEPAHVLFGALSELSAASEVLEALGFEVEAVRAALSELNTS